MSSARPVASVVTRFAPSPTGYLHRGHGYAAWVVADFCRQNQGRFLLRIEDIDTTRCTAAFTQAVFEDLAWLGLTWEEPVRIQSQHFADYQQALDQLSALGVVYACSCSRKDIMAAEPEQGPEGPIYPGLCKGKTIDLKAPHVLRLDLAKATALLKAEGRYPESWQDMHQGQVKTAPELLGDVVLKRKDTPTSYHVSVVVDDALQGITHVVRGQDLFHSTHIHVVLQALLGVSQPVYQHHQLIVDAGGQKLAKSRKSETIRALRAAGMSPKDIADF